MKRLIWVWLITGWLLFVGIRILIVEISGHPMDLLGCIIGASIGCCMVSFCIILVRSVAFAPRLKYLERSDNVKPPFKVTCSSVIDMPQGYDFNRLKSEIARKWVISFTDDTGHVLKFSKKTRFFELWATSAAWLKYDCDTGEIQLECFSLNSVHDNGLARHIQKELFETSEKV